MNNHVLIVAALIFAVAAVCAVMIWKALSAARSKNSEEWKAVLTKARAFSAMTLWIVFLSWTVITVFVDAGATFTLTNIRTFVIVLLGFQCLMELLAGIYLTRRM